MSNTNAMVVLGTCYEKGNGVSQDKKKAIGLFQQAADMGNTDAKAILDACSAAGVGVSQDKRRTIGLHETRTEMRNFMHWLN